jgi:glycosyltransferase involved in cell wall biosynthesis
LAPRTNIPNQALLGFWRFMVRRLRIGIVVPHIFMQDKILPNVIFSPGHLAIDLAENLQALGHTVTLFSPGPVKISVENRTADLSLFQKELDIRGDSYIDLLKKHPFTFVTLARQVQSELIAKAYTLANNNDLDVVHIYMNEEEIALPFAGLCNKPVVFTHHDPFNFLVKYKSLFSKYTNLNWISLSYAQRKEMPKNTNWVGNVYHGLPKNEYKPNYEPAQNYIVYMGRIIESKGVHLAIEAINKYNETAQTKISLKIAGKYYSGNRKDNYWEQKILPHLNDPNIEYVGFLKSTPEKQALLGHAKALIIPSIFEEPFGMVMIEALACATPIIGLDSGAIPEVINKDVGILIKKADAKNMTENLAAAISDVGKIDRHKCRKHFEQNFTSKRMAENYFKIYNSLI